MCVHACVCVCVCARRALGHWSAAHLVVLVEIVAAQLSLMMRNLDRS